ncbi:hypothetical protein Tco_0667894 [Tanacetum coccineum]
MVTTEVMRLRSKQTILLPPYISSPQVLLATSHHGFKTTATIVIAMPVMRTRPRSAATLAEVIAAGGRIVVSFMPLQKAPTTHARTSFYIYSLNAQGHGHIWISRLVKFSSDVTARVTFIQSRLRLTLKPFWLDIKRGTNDLVIREVKLGKHVMLPFSLSETIVKAPFDISHSDLWTSLLLVFRVIKILMSCFLDHFYITYGLYPLRQKSDVLSKGYSLRAYVKNHFNVTLNLCM